MRNDIGQHDKGQEKQRPDDLASGMTESEPYNDGAPGQKEPCLGVVPFHELNVIPLTSGFKV